MGVVCGLCYFAISMIIMLNAPCMIDDKHMVRSACTSVGIDHHQELNPAQSVLRISLQDRRTSIELSLSA